MKPIPLDEHSIRDDHESDFVSNEDVTQPSMLAQLIFACEPPPTQPQKRRKLKVGNVAQVAGISLETSAVYLAEQRSQKKSATFSAAEIVLFKTLYEELNMDCRLNKGWGRFEKRWKQEHNNDETEQIQDRKCKTLLSRTVWNILFIDPHPYCENIIGNAMRCLEGICLSCCPFVALALNDDLHVLTCV